jgi:hypothetical protein
MYTQQQHQKYIRMQCLCLYVCEQMQKREVGNKIHFFE